MYHRLPFACIFCIFMILFACFIMSEACCDLIKISSSPSRLLKFIDDLCLNRLILFCPDLELEDLAFMFRSFHYFTIFTDKPKPNN